MDVRDLDYDLPASAIAQRPLAERSAARLLVVRPSSGEIAHHQIRDLPELLPASLLIANDTRVLPARLLGHKAESGGRVELLLLERVDAIESVRPSGAATSSEADEALSGDSEVWRAMTRSSKPVRAGATLRFGEALEARVLASGSGMATVELRARVRTVREALDAVGHTPLPPYIRRDDDALDRERYQTVFAREEGAVAAPTAGLHFDAPLLDALTARGSELARVTLHVGPGTFRPVASERLEDHPMHTERCEVGEAAAAAHASARAEGRPVLAIGTTVVRTLESAVDAAGRVQPGRRTTDLFIRPPYRFRAVDALLTNFHLPKSTLLALVMAFGGVELVREAYRQAVADGYRFTSYGDAMLLTDPVLGADSGEARS